MFISKPTDSSLRSYLMIANFRWGGNESM